MTLNLKDAQANSKELPQALTKVLAVAVQRVAPSDSQMDKIKPFLLREFSADELYIRQMWLANDQPDRSYERFDLGYLGRFAETIQGKSVLIGHDYGSVPVGKFFDAEIIKDDESDWQWCAPWFYMPVSPGNQLDRDNIDSGVWSYVSIGASVDYAGLICDLCGQPYYPWTSRDAQAPSCPHYLGQSYDGKMATATWTAAKSDMSKVEAVEGSIVYLGCQYDAAIAKSAEQSQDLQARKREIITLSNTPSSDGEKSQEGVMNLEKLLEALGLKSAEEVQAEVSKLREDNTKLKTLADLATKLMDGIRAEIKGHMQFLGQPESIQCAVNLITDVDELAKMRDELANARAEKAAGSGQAQGEQETGVGDSASVEVKSSVVGRGHDVF